MLRAKDLFIRKADTSVESRAPGVGFESNGGHTKRNMIWPEASTLYFEYPPVSHSIHWSASDPVSSLPDFTSPALTTPRMSAAKLFEARMLVLVPPSSSPTCFHFYTGVGLDV